MPSLFSTFLLLLLIAFLPMALGYSRRLGHGPMVRIWLWSALPVAGWFVAMSIALGEPSRC